MFNLELTPPTPFKKKESMHHHFEATYSKKTRPSSDSEAATMYKLKGKSSNMQIGQGFK